MPEVKVEIGGRAFEVACQEGEEPYLQAAAKMLDEEAQVLSAQVGRMPEARMLLMAGLMLADKTASFEDEANDLRAKLEACQAELAALKNAPPPEPERIEIPVVPEGLEEGLVAMAAQIEALATSAEAKLSN